MKTPIRIRTFIAVLVTAIAIGAPATYGASYVIGLSPHYSTSDAQAVLKQFLLFVLEEASPGDEILVYDALHQQPVTQVIIPKGKLFENNARARATRLAPSITEVRRFLSSEPSSPQHLEGVVYLPEFLDLAGPQLRGPDQSLRIILIASPLYMNPQIPSFNMDDAYPSDAHLMVDQSISVFGTALRRHGLSDVTVHYAYLGNGGFVNDYHRERVARFWSLFVSRQQGVLATFAPDLGLTFRRAREGVRTSVVNAQLDPNPAKVEMLPVQRRPAPRWMASESDAVSPPQSETLRAAQLPVQTTQGRIGIGIMWSAPVDCDLWVKAHPAAKDLCFQNRTTPEGRYFHDYRSANQGVDYEYVELNANADLRSVKAWVNLYAGNANPIVGVVVLRLDGRSYRKEFRLDATRGNQAADRHRRDRSAHWTQLNLLQLVGTPPATLSAGRP